MAFTNLRITLITVCDQKTNFMLGTVGGTVPGFLGTPQLSAAGRWDPAVIRCAKTSGHRRHEIGREASLMQHLEERLSK